MKIIDFQKAKRIREQDKILKDKLLANRITFLWMSSKISEMAVVSLAIFRINICMIK